MALEMDHGDWVPVFRKLRDSWIWKDPEMLRAWLDLLMMANHRESSIPHAGQVLTIEPGQLPTTYQSLGKRWKWSRDRVQRFLYHLKDAGSVSFRRVKFRHKTQTWASTTSDRSIMILTLVNSPVRQRWLAERAQKPADSFLGTEHKTGRSPAHDVADHRQQLKQYPRGLNGGEGERGTTTTTPDVETTPHVGAEQAPEGTLSGLVVAVPEGTTGDVAQPTPPPEPQGALPLHLKKQASIRLGTPLLEALGMPPEVAGQLAAAYPTLRIYDVAEHAKGQDNPGGFARRCLESGWTVPAANGDGLARLTAALDAEAREREAAWARMGGAGRPRDPETLRRPGESEGQWVVRVNTYLKAKKAEGLK